MENLGERQRLKEKFRGQLLKHVELFNSAVSTGEGDWVVKGFIDIAKNIYTISVDTKVVSKIMELLLFPKISQFAKENDYKMVLSKEQNFYPAFPLLIARTINSLLISKARIEKMEKRLTA